MNREKNLKVLGFHFRSTGLEEREKWSVSPSHRPRFLSAVRNIQGVSECVYLSTCNRSELYIVSAKEIRVQAILETWSRFCPGTSPAISPGFLLSQEEATAYLFRVAASLDSMVVGETEILGQVKEAYQEALAQGVTGPWLNRLFQQALAQAKKIRGQTGIGRHPISVSTVAVKLGEQLFGPLNRTRVLVVGLGEMGTQTARYFLKRGVGGLYVSNRTEETAKTWVEKNGGCFIPFEQWITYLSQVDIAVCCTTGTPLLGRTGLQKTRLGQELRRLFLIDLGVPRNIDAGAAEEPGIYLYNVDDLRSIADHNLSLRRKEAEQAERLVLGAAKAVFSRVLSPPLRTEIA